MGSCAGFMFGGWHLAHLSKVRLHGAKWFGDLFSSPNYKTFQQSETEFSLNSLLILTTMLQVTKIFTRLFIFMHQSINSTPCF